jgi:hypothetical protein
MKAGLPVIITSTIFGPTVLMPKSENQALEFCNRYQFSCQSALNNGYNVICVKILVQR